MRRGRESSKNQHGVVAAFVELTPGLVSNRWAHEAAATVHRQFTFQRHVLTGTAHSSGLRPNPDAV